MRRLLDVLREGEPRYAPQPGLSRLDDLLDETRRAGVSVELVEEGERPELPPGLDLVAFRIVQESLTNARKHSGSAPARVALRYSQSELELEIVNEAGNRGPGRNGAGGGHGLIGMRERAHLFGGSFEAGEREGGGYRVRAVLPLEDTPA